MFLLFFILFQLLITVLLSHSYSFKVLFSDIIIEKKAFIKEV